MDTSDDYPDNSNGSTGTNATNNIHAVSTSTTSAATAAATTATTNTNSSNSNNNNISNREDDANLLKRRAIQEILRNPNLDEKTKRMQVQKLMSGNHHSLQEGSHITAAATGTTNAICTIATATSNVSGISTQSQMEVMKCVHYERKCNIVAPCCGKVFGCRVCHDEMSNHEMDRFAIREVVCKECDVRQPRSNKCTNCGIQFGEYHCNNCNLWMSTEKKPFHCEHCKICRVGGRDNFIHCHGCNMCISADTFDSHVCLKDKFKNSCPICREDMHSSRSPSLDLPCGHAIHTHCFRKLAGFDYRCPICKKTVVSPQNMARAWEERAREIESQPMPSDLARVVDIWCNDCEQRSEGRNWHFLGVQCPHCNSFNTAVENHSTQRSSGGGRNGMNVDR